MANDGPNQAILEDVQIAFRNFAGKEGQYNREGDRNFAVLLNPETAEAMVKDGWNVKYLKPREEGDTEQAYLSVAVNYKGPRPPRIVMITSKGRTPVPEEMVEVVDWVDIKQVDLILNPYSWSVNGKSGVKAYLKSLFVIIQEDYLELKYSDVPELGAGPDQVALESAERLAIEGGFIDAEIVED